MISDYGIYVNSNCTIYRRNFINTKWDIEKTGNLKINHEIYRHFEYCLIDSHNDGSQMLVMCDKDFEEKLKL